MKKITIFNAPIDAKLERTVDTDKDLSAISAQGDEIMDASDGYHTFTELYDHRITLFIALCSHHVWCHGLFVSNREAEHTAKEAGIKPVWRSKKNGDGSVWDGWFILGIGKEKGEQITYHLPMDRWEETSFAETLDQAPEWDRHTSADVLERLKKL